VTAALVLGQDVNLTLEFGVGVDGAGLAQHLAALDVGLGDTAQQATGVVTGGSYGGFMTNWIIGHTDRFCCAASQRSIANWISMSCTTDIGYYFSADQNNCDTWSDQEKLWWHSPLRYANQVKTPTLFIHSEEDYRCWLTEGLQMFNRLV